MGHALPGVDIPKLLSNRNFSDKVPERQDNFSGNYCEEPGCPRSLPREPRQRKEQYTLQKISSGVEDQLRGGTATARGEARPPFVVVESVEGSDESLKSQEIEGDLHKCTCLLAPLRRGKWVLALDTDDGHQAA